MFTMKSSDEINYSASFLSRQYEIISEQPDFVSKRFFLIILHYHLEKLFTMQRRNSLCHVMGWTVFIFYEMGLLLVFQPLETTLPNLAYYPFYIIQFYVCLWLIKIGFVHSNLRFALILIVQWLISASIFWMVGVSINDISIAKAFNKMDVCVVLWRSGYFTILAATFWFIQQHVRNIKQQAQLQQRLLQSENAYLRAQVNPHWLFNTLNYIHGNLIDDKEIAASSILLLSQVMQYASVQDSEDSKALLYQEIENLERQVALYRLSGPVPRLVISDIDTSGVTDSYRIPPMLLLNFVENMFKHGDNTQPYHIRLSCAEDRLYFSTKNSVKTGGNTSGYQTGLSNAETRLNNLYEQGAYALHTEEDENTFTVNLILKL
jgi:two-component system LytT family sensor kinase